MTTDLEGGTMRPLFGGCNLKENKCQFTNAVRRARIDITTFACVACATGE
jgi:hypothetical protein